MGHDGRHEAADGVGEDCLGCELTVAYGVEHGGVGAQIAAPAHADGREDCDGVAVDPALLDEVGHEPQGCSHGAESRDGEGDEMGVGEAE